MSLLSFYIPRRHLEKRGFLIFSVGIEGIEGIVASFLSSDIGLLSKSSNPLQTYVPFHYILNIRKHI